MARYPPGAVPVPGKDLRGHEPSQAGTYDAVRVLLGEGKGKNFWCVLYPSLCYVDSTHAVVPEGSRDQLKALLPEDDFSALMPARLPSALRLPGHEKTGQKASKDALPRVNGTV